MEFGRKRLQAEFSRRGKEFPQIGTREAAIVIDGPIPPHRASSTFLNELQIAKPKHSGWTAWVDSRNAAAEADRPYVFDGAWEALLVDLHGGFLGPHFNFWRIDPKGLFYHLDGLEDDFLSDEMPRKPGRTLEFFLQVSRVTEIISVGLSFARSMGRKEEGVSLAFAFRWVRLADRRLVSWYDQRRSLHSRGRSHQDEIMTSTVVPLEVAGSAIAAHVEEAINPLFELFDGTRLESRVVEGIVSDILDRHL